MPYRPLRVAEIRGFELRLDPSLVLLVALLLWVFAARFTPAHGLATAVVMGAATAALVVLTTLLHELAHALEARHRGIEVDAITLLLFGGVTEMHATAPTARDELAVAAVGPYVSLVAAAAAGVTATFVGDLVTGPVGAQIAEVAGILGWWNLALAVFNIVPGAPLDGGRVLRAVLWMVLGDRLKALRASVRAGQLLALVLVASAVWIATRPAADTLTAVAVAGVLIVTAAGLFHAATSELRQAELDAVLSGSRVADVLAHTSGTPAAAAPTATEPVSWVHLDDDLHTLVAQFRDGDRPVGVVDGPPTVLTEADVADALRALRRHRTSGSPTSRARSEPPLAGAGDDAGGRA